MKRAVLVLAVPLLLSGTACGGDSPVAPQPLPTWLTILIGRLEAIPPANPPALIARYEYRGQTVYFLPERCCDVPSTLYRADGTILCHPSGGLSGTGDGNCADFFTERRDEVIVWRDQRSGGGR